MLISHQCRQPVGSVKRWFSDFDNDLFVWLSTDHQITAFQYSYNKTATEQIISCNLHNGFSHGRVDDGEDVHLQIKMSPVIVPLDNSDGIQIAEKFLKVCAKLEPPLVDFIYRKLLAYLASRPA